MRLLDLSVPINERTPVYPGDPKTKVEPAGIMAKDGFNDHYVSIGTHAGTHIDAPLHMIDGGKSLDQMPLEQFVGRGVLVEVKDKKFDLAAVQQAGVQKDDIVLFHTGFSDIYHQPEYFEHPSITEEIANYLVEKKVKMVGVDMASPDHPPFKIHKILLGGGVLIIENLTDLAQLAGKDFTVYALPIKLQIDAAPARVIVQMS